MYWVLVSVIFLTALIVSSYVGFHTWKMDGLGSNLFAGFSLGVSLWLLGSWVELGVPQSALDTVMIQVHFLGIILTSVFLFLFSIRYASGYSLSNRQLGLLLIIPSIDFLMVLLNPWLNLFWTSTTQLSTEGLYFSKLEFGPFLVIHSIYSYALIIIAALVFVRLLFNRKKLFKLQAVPVIIAIIVPLAISMGYTLRLIPMHSFDPTPLSLTVTQVLFLVALYYTNFYSVVPGIQRVGWHHISDVVDTGVCITDTEQTIVEYNTYFEKICDLPEEQIVGSTISEMCDSLTVKSDDQIIQHGREYFKISQETLMDNQENHIGFVYTFSNVTDEIESQQQIRVLNRFLRHNLRNTLSVVLLATERFSLVDVKSEEDAELIDDNIEMVKNSVDKLMSMSDAAKDVENAIQVSNTSCQSLKQIVQNSIQKVKEKNPSNAEFSVSVDDVDVEAVQNFEIAIEQVLQNSLQHTSVDSLEIMITTKEMTDETVTLQIEDNGRGISDEAKDSFETELEAESQDPLYHGTGLGFGIANWLAVKSNGEFNIRDSDAGAVVDFVLNRSTCSSEM